jgi:cytochrome P450
VIRTGPNSLSFNSATALVAIYGSRDANVRRADWYETLDAPSGSYSTLSTMSKKEHAFRRRVLDQAFSTKAVRDSEQYIDQKVRQFVQCMGENLQEDGWSKPVNFDEWITYFGFDVIGSLSFGSSFNLLEHDANRYIPEMLVSTNKFLYYVCRPSSHSASPRSEAKAI